MTYLSQSALVDDIDLRRRIVACAAIDGVDEADFWVHQNRWVLATQDAWEAAYAGALDQDVPAPGRSQAVISDDMILTAVQTIRAGGTA